jgi:hypothetical protein
MTYCHAPWFEINLSAADDRVVNCCDYTDQGARLLSHGTVRSIRDLWHDPGMIDSRRIQAGLKAGPHGCSGCPHSVDTAPLPTPNPLFICVPESLTAEQAANLELARQEYAARALTPRALPVNYRVFFGWGCNLRCTICNQVPHRELMREKLPAQAFAAWRDDLRQALMVECIGGEPFAIPSGLAFMRLLAEAEDLASVRMLITSNGTLLHQHLDWLKAKRRISFNISIDSVGEGYEAIRVGGHWERLAGTLRAIRRISGTERPEWHLVTNALVTRTGLLHLPDFARFHVAEDIHTGFIRLRFTPGIEEVLYQEDILRYPHLLDTVPQWEQRFAEAIAIFREGGFAGEAAALESILGECLTARQGALAPEVCRRKVAEVGCQEVRRMILGPVGFEEVELGEAGGRIGFHSPSTRSGVAAGINLNAPADGLLRVAMEWPATPEVSPCRLVIHDQEDFALVAWSETRRDGMIVKQALVRARRATAEPLHLVLSLMASRADGVSHLPDRLSVWFSD